MNKNTKIIIGVLTFSSGFLPSTLLGVVVFGSIEVATVFGLAGGVVSTWLVMKMINSEQSGAMTGDRYEDLTFVPVNTRAMWATLLLVVTIVVQVVAVISDFREINLLDEMKLGRIVSDQEATASDDRQAAIALIKAATMVVTAIVFLIWMHRAYNNLPSLKQELRYSPKWAVWGWFVPLLNVVRPRQILKKIWEGSMYDESPLIYWWWVLFGLAVVVIPSLSQFGGDGTISDILVSSYMVFVSDLLKIPAAILAILIVRRITAEQPEKLIIISKGADKKTPPWV